jgi:NADP-dependent 3-hydroxy acid dehydrogenase YdfG
MLLSDKVAVISGASGGIGKEIALRLAREKVSLALVARNKEKLDIIVEEAARSGSPQAVAYTCDLLDVKQVESTVKQIAAHFNKINILVNMAGVWQKMNYLEDIPSEEIQKVIDVNLTSLIQFTKYTIPFLKEQKDAAIINMSSRSGVQAMDGQTIYCASKWGVRGFTEVLKNDLRDTNVRVAGLYPAGIKTEILEKAGDRISMDEYTDPKDIAETVFFMLSRPPKIWLHEVRVVY